MVENYDDYSNEGGDQDKEGFFLLPKVLEFKAGGRVKPVKPTSPTAKI